MPADSLFEAQVPEGLEAVTLNELRTRLGGREKLLLQRGPGIVHFRYDGRLPALLQLHSVLSLFQVEQFDVPRPRALMGHQNFQRILELVRQVIQASPKGTFKTAYLATAGSDSAVMARFIQDIAAQTGLTVVREEGDLLVRVRRPLDNGRQEEGEGWEVLIRLAPRPLSARKWRVCDIKGGLNAAVAYAAALQTRPAAGDVFLNLASGSGTLLIERAACGPAQRLIGCDIDPAALDCARQNIVASGNKARIQVFPWDAGSLPLADSSVDALCADLPFGLDVGSHQDNVTLYPRILAEAARVARPKARCVLLTQEIRLLGSLLETSPYWVTDQVLPVTITGLRPRIYVLARNSQPV